MKHWLVLVASIPGARRTARMRIWRALRACGAATLRDGVYLLPDGDAARTAFELQAREIRSAGGTAFLLPLRRAAVGSAAFEKLFDRSADYRRVLQSLRRFERALGPASEAAARRRLATLRREIAVLQEIDFFESGARRQAESALARAERAVNAEFSQDEPRAVRSTIEVQRKADYRGCVWATRRNLWIDRVCSAWLIRRFIDPEARFLWLSDPRKCPREAVGFDFDTARFTHIDGRVTFQVLAASFGLDRDVAIARLGALVRYLDVGGAPVAEAAGLETLMAGARASSRSDDAVLAAMTSVLDSLYAAYSSVGRTSARGRTRTG